MAEEWESAGVQIPKHAAESHLNSSATAKKKKMVGLEEWIDERSRRVREADVMTLCTNRARGWQTGWVRNWFTLMGLLDRRHNWWMETDGRSPGWDGRTDRPRPCWGSVAPSSRLLNRKQHTVRPFFLYQQHVLRYQRFPRRKISTSETTMTLSFPRLRNFINI